MIFRRRDLLCPSQDEIAYELGLIVPEKIALQFSKVRTGPEPKAGYGTQTSKSEFSIESYFERNNVPLKRRLHKITSLVDLRETIINCLRADEDIIICYNSQELFGEGDIEHVSLVQSIDAAGNLEIIDPAIGAPPVKH